MSHLVSEETAYCCGHGWRTCWRLEAFQAWSGLTENRWCLKFRGNTAARKTGRCVTAAFSWYVVSPHSTLPLVFLVSVKIKVKIIDCVGPYCGHEVYHFLLDISKLFLFLSHFKMFLKHFFKFKNFNLNIFLCLCEHSSISVCRSSML